MQAAKANMFNGTTVACQPLLSQNREKMFFFKCICFSQIKERDPTLQKKNDPTSRESKGDKRESDGIQAELEQTDVCSRLMCVLAEGSNQQFLTVHTKCNMTRVCVLFFQLHKATIQ